MWLFWTLVCAFGVATKPYLKRWSIKNGTSGPEMEIFESVGQLITFPILFMLASAKILSEGLAATPGINHKTCFKGWRRLFPDMFFFSKKKQNHLGMWKKFSRWVLKIFTWFFVQKNPYFTNQKFFTPLFNVEVMQFTANAGNIACHVVYVNLKSRGKKLVL